MHFHISRNGQTYGPYTLEDLQRYLASGNVLATDLAKSDQMSEWIPVSQILASSASAGSPSGPSGYEPTVDLAPQQHGAGYRAPLGTGYPDPQAGTPYAAPAAYGQQPGAPVGGGASSPYPDAPNLNWGLVLLFGLLTCTLFMVIWNLVVAAWLRRVQPNATSLFYYLGAPILMVLQWSTGLSYTLHHIASPGLHMYIDHPLTGILGLAVWVVRLIARFSQKASLEEHFNTVEPLGLRLSGVMTFFFGGVYFQYHLNRINAIKQAARYGMGRQF